MADTNPDSRSPEEDMAVMSLGEHLEELRTRLLRSLVAVGAAFFVCFLCRGWLRVIIQRPHVQAMQAFELPTALKFAGYFESLVVQLKVCAVSGLLIVSPYVIYQIWAFVAPGLFRHERSRALKLGVACAACFLAGVVFGYFVFIPTALRYLILLSGGWAEPVLMISNYFSLLLLLTVAVALAFQTPLVVFYLVRWGVLDVRTLQRRRKGVILGAFVVGAVITPPDPVTQMMMAVTLIMLYDLGGLLAAPSWTTFREFGKFAGAVALVALAAVLWVRFWPVGRLEAVRGSVTAGERVLAAGQEARVTRGAMCRAGAAGIARLTLGRHGDAEVVLAPGARLQVHGSGEVSMYAGDFRARAKEGAELRARTAVASAEMMGAVAQIAVPDGDTVTVSVFEGEVAVKAGGQERAIRTGEKATFRRGGEPTDLGDAERRWEGLLSPPPVGTGHEAGTP